MFPLVLINSLRGVVGPPTYSLPRCLEDWLAGWLAGKRRVGGADSSAPDADCPSWTADREEGGGRMKEKSLIETAKMQGNVLVRRLVLCDATNPRRALINGSAAFRAL